MLSYILKVDTHSYACSLATGLQPLEQNLTNAIFKIAVASVNYSAFFHGGGSGNVGREADRDIGGGGDTSFNLAIQTGA